MITVRIYDAIDEVMKFKKRNRRSKKEQTVGKIDIAPIHQLDVATGLESDLKEVRSYRYGRDMFRGRPDAQIQHGHFTNTSRPATASDMRNKR
jgi:hypothetical protein